MKVKHLLQCHLLLPGLLPELAVGMPRLAGLERLLAFADGYQVFAGCADSWLCRTFNAEKQNDWPAAPFSARGEGMAPGALFWLRADPVHLHLLRDSLSVADCQPFDLHMEEAQRLLATLNAHFAADGLQFAAPDPNRWYVAQTEPAALATVPLAEAVGRDVDMNLPKGADAVSWHRWINEVQMLLHDHPVNLEREQRGQWPVNSIWPWGGGVLSQAEQPFDAVWTENVLTKGLAGNATIESSPASLDEWLTPTRDGMHLIELDTLNHPRLRQHPGDWQQMLQQLDRLWFSPLFEQLKANRISRIELHLAGFDNVRSFVVERPSLWKFWRRPKPLENYLHG